jgi:hypothetical protein
MLFTKESNESDLWNHAKNCQLNNSRPGRAETAQYKKSQIPKLNSSAYKENHTTTYRGCFKIKEAKRLLQSRRPRVPERALQHANQPLRSLFGPAFCPEDGPG